MLTEFAALTMSRPELEEFYRALISRHLIENALRHEQGLEGVDPSPLLQKMNQLMGITDEAAHATLHQMEDELWAYAWYAYTDEWAWFRAEQDVEKSLGSKRPSLKREALERLVEERYHQYFDTYATEIDMHEKAKHSTKRKTKRQG